LVVGGAGGDSTVKTFNQTITHGNPQILKKAHAEESEEEACQSVCVCVCVLTSFLLAPQRRVELYLMSNLFLLR